MNPKYAFVAERARHRCEYCHAPEVIFNLPFEVEHVTPRSKFGTDDDLNLALACRACNLFKADSTTGPSEAASATVRLFDPRHDRWEDHFSVSTDSTQIVGKTSIGQATVEQLRMNDVLRCNARKQWARLGLFP